MAIADCHAACVYSLAAGWISTGIGHADLIDHTLTNRHYDILDKSAVGYAITVSVRCHFLGDPDLALAWRNVTT